MQNQNHATSVSVAIRRSCVCGVMIALAVVFCRLLGFPQTGDMMWRLEISFLPIAVIALLFGPVWSGVSYGIADLIGAAIFTGINPFITIEKVLTGAVMGILFYGRKRIGPARILGAMLTISVLLDFFMMALIFHYGFGYAWNAALIYRGVNAAVNFALRTVILFACDARLTEFAMRGRLKIDGRRFS